MQRPPSTLQLYCRIVFGLIVAFILIGNCTGHRDPAVTLMFVVSIAWTLVRIIEESFDSYAELRVRREAKKDPDDNDPEDKEPPSAPAT